MSLVRIGTLVPGDFFRTVLTDRCGRVSSAPNVPFGTHVTLSDPFEEKVLHPETWVVSTEAPKDLALYLPSLDVRRCARRVTRHGAGPAW